MAKVVTSKHIDPRASYDTKRLHYVVFIKTFLGSYCKFPLKMVASLSIFVIDK